MDDAAQWPAVTADQMRAIDRLMVEFRTEPLQMIEHAGPGRIHGKQPARGTPVGVGSARQDHHVSIGSRPPKLSV
jgi:hypothetical protein